MSDLFVISKEPGPATATVQPAGARPPDAAERERALDVGHSWIVEAPAGSGKTGLLIQRYLKLLAEESVAQPEQVLAITFTKKAAAEIRDRVLVQLEAAARGEAARESQFERETRRLAEAVLEKNRVLGWELLENRQRMNLKTIDSLCAVIAGSMPVLSGGGGGMRPAEDALPLYQAAARQTVMQLGGEDGALSEALRQVLLHRDGNLAECEKLLADMLALRDQWGELIPLQDAQLTEAYLDGTVLPKLQRALERIVCAGLTQLAESVSPVFLEELAALASSFAEIPPYGREVSPLASCAGRSVPGTDAEHLEQWRALIHLLVTPSSWTWRKGFAKNYLGFETTKAEKERLREVLDQIGHRDDLLEAMRRVDRLPPAEYPAEQWRVAKALFRLLSRALVELQLVFAERQECDFAETMLLARGALQQTGGVLDLQEALGIEFRHLLVDEMQDTSTIQYELIELLTQDWDGEHQTVFLVGDPKQSIYLFRQARVERFVRIMQEQQLGNLRVGYLRLTANFRSQRGLVEEFNTDFSLLFPTENNPATPDEIPYEAADAVRGSVYSDVGLQWHTHVVEAKKFSVEARTDLKQWQKQEARTVRNIASQWRARQLPEGRSEPWKIAVLVQNRRHLVDIVAALKEEGGEGPIPFSAVKIDELAERQEVMDLFALTRALLHPADRVAWLAILRAPWCGLSLAELHTIAGGDDTDAIKRTLPGLIASRYTLLSTESQLRLQRVAATLQVAEGQRGRLRISEWVERTWRSLGGDVSLAEAELGNAQRYLQLLADVERENGTLEVSVLIRRMAKLYAQSTPGPGAVELMTVHAAKGLEWDVVMVPGLARQSGRSRSGLLVWNEIENSDADSAHGMLAPIAGRGATAQKLNCWMKGLHDAREAAERKRLFYVACTRAREELHLFAAPQRSATGEIQREPSSLLKAAWPAAARHFEEPPTESFKILRFPSNEASTQQGLTIAATSEAQKEPHPNAATLDRLPPAFDPTERFRTAEHPNFEASAPSSRNLHFERPEGSFAARAFGNAVHKFLELAATHLAAGVTVNELAADAAGWGARIEAVLRGEGLPPAVVKREAQRVLTALTTALQDNEGQWLLGMRQSAGTEFGLTTWGDTRRSFRFDRLFVGGDRPLATGTDCLWIVDYKTSTFGRGVGAEAFLQGERDKYEAQMHSYALAISAAAGGRELRVGLYYPLLPKLLWWKPRLEE